jgi:small nuclear ribonucleoprotein (snRNP)-like protein
MANGKPGNGGGMGPNQALEFTRRINEANSRAVENEKRIIELEKTVNDKSQWNTTVRGWMGTKVSIRLLTGEHVVGDLRALDRYTLLVDGSHMVDTTVSDGGIVATKKAVDDTPREIIIHKGAIATISRI